MSFTASLRSELRKIKGTSLIYLVLIAAFIIPFILLYDYDSPDPNKPANGWDNFYLEGMRPFVFVFIPLFYVLASTLLMQIEVRNNTWKQVLASPQSFFHILLAKFWVLQLLGLSFIAVFNIYVVLSAALLDWIGGEKILSYLEHWPEMVKINLMAYGSTIGISALCFWLALRSKNFIAPVAIGLLMWFAGPIGLEVHWQHIDKYVFALPFTVLFKKFADDPVFHQLLSIGYGVFFFGIAYLEFVMKRIKLGRYLMRRVHPLKFTSSTGIY
jgi:lantibiotic transport system permease protein